VKMEGTFEASALLYIPSKAPWDLYQPEMKRGVQLYVKRVFIMDECKELMPSWLRFVKGVVDAQDLSLNVSREILQKSRQIQAIKKQLVKRVLDTLDELKTTSKEDHLKFWRELGPVMKEGLVAQDVSEKDRILGLMLTATTHHESELTTLEDYVSRMKEGQDAIYYLTGPTLESVRGSPHLELFKDKGYEVLLFADGIDELWLERDAEFKGRAFRSVGKGDVELGTAEEKAKAKADAEAKEGELKGLLTALRVAIQDDVKEVRPSVRLTSSAACLVGDEGDMSPQLQKIIAQMGQAVPKTKRILEINPSHPLIERLAAIHGADAASPLIADYARLLYGQAVLAEGGQLADPAAFAKVLSDVMVRAARA
jgi:molecular chaperone HtpG